MKIVRVVVLSLLVWAANTALAQVQDEVRVLFNQFIKSDNAHNLAAVGQILHDSCDFLWIPPHGAPVVGRDTALQQMTELYQGTWRLEPDMSALKITPLGDNAARLYVPIKYTIGAADKAAQPEPYVLNQVYVRTSIGWRISAILTVPVPRQ